MTTSSSHINVDITPKGIATITLNRPEVHNAFNGEVVQQLDSAIGTLDADAKIRVIILTGAGASFSAGADLRWMQEIAKADETTNFNDAMALAGLLRNLAHSRTPTIARVNGAAYGGGIGLIACCDIAVGTQEAKFGLSETRLGLVPAVISPYVIQALGPRQATRLFMTAEVFDGDRAQQLGLLHRSVEGQTLDQAVAQEVSMLMKGGPQALYAAKSLVGAVAGRTPDSQKALDQATAKLIASLRVSPEGQEGIAAFLQKRPPNWVHSDQ